MNPEERLQGAIDRLESLKSESTPGRWSVNVHHNAMHTAEFRARNPYNGFILVAAHVNDRDPELIVTLHRTIDAQLAILRGTLARATAAINGGAIERFVWSRDTEALALADAILEQSAS